MCFVPEYSNLHNTTSLLHHIILGSQHSCVLFLLIEIDKKNTRDSHVISLCLRVFVHHWLNRCILVHTPPLLISLFFIYPPLAVAVACGVLFLTTPPTLPPCLYGLYGVSNHLSHKSPLSPVFFPNLLFVSIAEFPFSYYFVL
jgi:hypothetical protein